MEILRRYVALQPTLFAAYLALQLALMRRHLARGGTLDDFCLRLAPVFHRRYGPMLLGGETAPQPLLEVCSPRLLQESHRLPGSDRTGVAESAAA